MSIFQYIKTPIKRLKKAGGLRLYGSQQQFMGVGVSVGVANEICRVINGADELVEAAKFAIPALDTCSQKALVRLEKAIAAIHLPKSNMWDEAEEKAVEKAFEKERVLKAPFWQLSLLAVIIYIVVGSVTWAFIEFMLID